LGIAPINIFLCAGRAKTGGEVLFFYSSDRCTRPGEYEAEERIREAGARFRSLIEEGSTTTTSPNKASDGTLAREAEKKADHAVVIPSFGHCRKNS
jgi:hypothetical protein